MNLETMTRDERSLLLFLETCLVDKSGKVVTAHMNEDDFDIAKRWQEQGFILFQRIPFKEVKRAVGGAGPSTRWVRFSDEAWALAHQERRARAVRVGTGFSWRTNGGQGV